jgi:hypothetical protein
MAKTETNRFVPDEIIMLIFILSEGKR